MNNIIKVTALVIINLYSATTFAHSGHGNTAFHNHNGSENFLVILIVGALIGFATHYIVKKNSSK